MAFCRSCQTEFLTTPEEERLMVTGAIEEVCLKCAMAGAKVEEDPNFVPMPSLWPKRKFIKRSFLRVELRNPEGEPVSFIAMEPGPYYPKHRERKLPAHRPRVQILGNPASGMEPNYVTIISNLSNFEKEDRDLFAKKFPNHWDPRTGIDEIRIARNRVKRIIHEANGVLAQLEDGGSVAGYFPIDGEFRHIPFDFEKYAK